jgi:protein arginine kinase
MSAQTLMASAISLARNDASHAFPHVAGEEALVEVRDRVLSGLDRTREGLHWQLYDLQRLSSVDTTSFVEKGLMTPSFSRATGAGRGFAVYGEGLASLEVNGGDHIQLLGFRQGDRLSELWDMLTQLDDELETVTTYAFDSHRGYLTARPALAGTGMRVYATVHVPALMLTGRLAGAALELMAEGYGLAPLWGGAGGLMQISNLGRLGKPETEVLSQAEEVSRGMVEKERSVRKMLLRETPVSVRDHIGRAIGVAQHAWSVTFPEAVNLVSATVVGMEMGIVEAPGLPIDAAFDFTRRLQAAHVVTEKMQEKTGSLDSPEIDEIRARVLRMAFLGAEVR